MANARRWRPSGLRQHLFTSSAELVLYTTSWPGTRSGHAILTADALAMPALVMLTGRLPADTQASGDIGPPDLQADCVVDQKRQLGVQLVPLQPRPADPLQHLR